MLTAFFAKFIVSTIVLFSSLTFGENQCCEVEKEHNFKSPLCANQSDSEEVVISETYLVLDDGIEYEKCKLCDSCCEEDRGPIENCFNDHLVYYTGLNGAGHTTTGVTAYISCPSYVSATYYFYVDTGFFLCSNPFTSGTTFYHPGIYYLSVRCICNQVYSTSFTIVSADYTTNNYSATQNGEPITNCSYILTNTLSYTKGSIYGHVESVINFPYVPALGGSYNSLLNSADYFDLYYSCKINRGLIKFKPDSTCIILYEYTYFAENGFSYDDPYPYLGTYNFEIEVDIEDINYPEGNIDSLLFMQLNYFRNIGNTANTSYPINNIGLTITIDFDIQSNFYYGSNNYMPLNGFRAFNLDFAYDFIFVPEDPVSIDIQNNINVMSYIFLDYCVSTALDVIPYVGPILSIGYSYFMYYIGVEVEISGQNHIRLTASITVGLP